MRNWNSRLLVGMVALLIAGGALEAQTAPAPAKAPAAEGDAAQALHSVAFKRFVDSIQAGEKLGRWEFSIFCNNGKDIVWNDDTKKVVNARFVLCVGKELEKAHIPSPKKSESVFDDGAKPDSPDLELGVMLKKMTMNLCTTTKSKGEVTLEAKWALLNPKTQKQVGEFASKGSYSYPERDLHWTEILDRAIVNLTENLLSQPAFKASLTSPLDSAPVQGNSHAYSFPAVQPPKDGTVKSSTLLRSAVVTVETEKGTGSGFFISRDGYLLTNNHVVGEAKFVKVKTATGRELPGEVLAFDARRDVALVKTVKVPFDPLSLRLTDPTQGEDVYAIGSPLGDDFNGTMSHGVVSGFRDTERGRFLQSDVSVLPGNSGGPLLDQKGAVVGIAVISGGTRGGNMNFFVPIAEALEKLSIQVK